MEMDECQYKKILLETDQLREVTVADSLESSGLDLTDSLSWYQWRINNETQKKWHALMPSK